jgi:glycosyltransferase involved in cell wall biosynthesis
MKILSLALATYNMEQYLERCLDSVLINEILDVIEVIIVNDGSTDNSLAIANEYKKKYPQSVIVIDKENGHTGSCWNAALKIASGKYFRLLDTDDWFDSQAFVKVVNKLKGIEVDLLLTNYSLEFMPQHISSVAIKKLNRIAPDKIYDRNDLEMLTINPRLIGLPAETYNMQVLKNIDFTWTEKIPYSDIEYNYYPYAAVNSFLYFDAVLYKNLIGREGQTININYQIKNISAKYIILKKMLQDGKNRQVNVLQEHILAAQLTGFYFYMLCLLPKNSENEAMLKDIDDLLKNIHPNLYDKIYKYGWVSKFMIQLWRKKGIFLTEYISPKIVHKTFDFTRHLRSIIR